MPKGYNDSKEYKTLKSTRPEKGLGSAMSNKEREQTARHLEKLAKNSKTEAVEDTTRTELREHAAKLRTKPNTKRATPYK